MAPCALVVFWFDSVGDMDNKDRSLAVVLQCRFLLGLQSPTLCLMNKTYCNFTQVTGASTFCIGWLSPSDFAKICTQIIFFRRQ